MQHQQLYCHNSILVLFYQSRLRLDLSLNKANPPSAALVSSSNQATPPRTSLPDDDASSSTGGAGMAGGV
jgi:hypothetical protein